MRLELGARFGPRLHVMKGFSQWKRATVWLGVEEERVCMADDSERKIGKYVM